MIFMWGPVGIWTCTPVLDPAPTMSQGLYLRIPSPQALLPYWLCISSSLGGAEDGRWISRGEDMSAGPFGSFCPRTSQHQYTTDPGYI